MIRSKLCLSPTDHAAWPTIRPGRYAFTAPYFDASLAALFNPSTIGKQITENPASSYRIGSNSLERA